MDPENPSRRKKSGTKAVTIDLEAVPASASNEAVAPEPVEETEAAAEAATATDTAASADTATPETTTPETDKTDDTSPFATKPAEETPRETSADEPRAATPPPRQGGNAGALAAGILGGLVALIAAGSLQYGGYLPSPSPAQRDNGDITALSAEVETLKQSLAQAGEAAPAVDLQPLEQRIAALESRAAEDTAAAPAENAEAITTLEADLARLSTEVTALRDALARTTTAINETETQLNERIAAAEQKLEEPRGDVEMARAVAASALKTAIDRGGPYLAELEAFASVAPDDPSIAGLREHATLGVVSRSDLVRDFSRTAADRILDAIHQPDGDQGIINRLMASAASAIRVRPVGSVEGDTPEAIVARIETKLQNGDFKGAQIEWQTLPEAGQAAAADYKRSLDQRVTVEDLVGAAVSGAMAGNQG